MKCLKLFQEYQQEFQTIAASLEACNWLSTINQDDSFYMGLPKTFRKKLKSELQVQRLWTDLSSLPEMCCVVQVAELLLLHNWYYDDSNDKDICDNLDESDLDSEDHSDHCGSSQDLVEDMKLMSIVQTQVPDQNSKSKLVELMEQLDKLMVQLA